MGFAEKQPSILAVALAGMAFALGCAAGAEAVPSAVGGSTGAGGTNAGSGGTTGSGGSPTGSGGNTMSGTGGATTGTGGRAGTATGGATGSGGATGTGGSVAGTGGRTVTTPPRFALPWMDDFEANTVGGGATGWYKDPADVTSKWAVAADGATKVFQESVVLSDLAMIVGGDVAWTDQKVEARVKIPVATTDALVFLAARFIDFDHYYFLHLKGDGSIKIRKRIAGSTTDLVTYKSNMPMVAGTWYTIGFGIKGSTVTAYLNGAAVGTLTEAAASHPAGGIALGVQDTAASFDDVKVTVP